MVLNGWEVEIFVGTKLTKGYVEFYYSWDCNNDLFAEYFHRKDKGNTYVTKRKISGTHVTFMMEEADKLYSTLIEDNGDYYYKSYMIQEIDQYKKDDKPKFVVDNMDGERLNKKFDTVEEAVKFIDKRLEK